MSRPRRISSHDAIRYYVPVGRRAGALWAHYRGKTFGFKRTSVVPPLCRVVKVKRPRAYDLYRARRPTGDDGSLSGAPELQPLDSTTDPRTAPGAFDGIERREGFRRAYSANCAPGDERQTETAAEMNVTAHRATRRSLKNSNADAGCQTASRRSNPLNKIVKRSLNKIARRL